MRAAREVHEIYGGSGTIAGPGWLSLTDRFLLRFSCTWRRFVLTQEPGTRQIMGTTMMVLDMITFPPFVCFGARRGLRLQI